MSIVGSGNDVRVEYMIPPHIKQLITDSFLKEFRNQLFRIFEFGLDTFAECGIPADTSTSGWFAAFGKACLLTNNEELLNYWRTLPWYDSDIFDGELADMLIDRKFILDDTSKIIEEKLGIKEEDLVICDDCGKTFTKDMVVKYSYEESNEFFSEYRCLHCQDIKNTKDGNRNATDYYRSVLKELEVYKQNHPICEAQENRTVLMSNGNVDALDVIKSSGFKDTTPEISTCTKKIFEKDGKRYRCLGWHHLNQQKHWEDVELQEISDN